MEEHCFLVRSSAYTQLAPYPAKTTYPVNGTTHCGQAFLHQLTVKRTPHSHGLLANLT